jgi:uncharacterized protein YigE (DUF2233 family)
MVRRHTLFFFLLSLAAGLRAETIDHGGASFWIYGVDPKAVKIELFLPEKAGEPNTFPKLEAQLAAKGRRLVFAMNSGIYEGNFRPTGLHVSDGVEITPLNLKDFVKRTPEEPVHNFFLKPNGVFFLRRDGSAAVVESARYATLGETPVLATQSGPLLVEGGRIHPVLQPASTSKRYRNGVGVTKEGQVVFACSVLEPDKGMSNLYRFAELFRDRLACTDALYLDGDISYIHLRGLTGPVKETNWFAGILAVTEKAE